MKSEVFNGQRFWSYFKYDFVQMWRNNMKASVGIGLSGLILYMVVVIFSLIFGGGWQGPGVIPRFMVFILASAALELYQTRTYGYLTERRKGSAWLMNPASSFEKWLSMIIMTIIVIPIAFLVVYLFTDLIVTSLDPTTGSSMLHTIGGGFREITDELVKVNAEYSTTWSPWAFVPAVLMGCACNFMYFLLCGISFKRYKILYGLVISFVAGLVLSIILSQFGIQYINMEIQEFSDAEQYIRSVFNISMWATIVITIGLAAGIYYRIKTIKH
jgi:hypothetical protein